MPDAADMSRGRAEAFSDGVFAVAITLLIFNVHVPEARGDLTAELLRQWPAYAAYVASFLTIGVMWINHHRIFTLLARVDSALLLLNLLLLMCIAFLPFPTTLLGEHIGQGADARTAAVAYSLNATLIAIAFGALWVYALNREDVLAPHVDRDVARSLAPRFMVGTFVYAASIALAFWSPIAVLPLYALLAIYYTFNQLPAALTARQHE